jgi:hypothetical protein
MATSHLATHPSLLQGILEDSHQVALDGQSLGPALVYTACHKCQAWYSSYQVDPGTLTLGACVHQSSCLDPHSEQIQQPTMQAVTASRALKILEVDPDAQLLDIRPREDTRTNGTPDLKACKKSVLSLPYKPAVGPQEGSKASTVSIGWAERVGRMAKVQ